MFFYQIYLHKSNQIYSVHHEHIQLLFLNKYPLVKISLIQTMLFVSKTALKMCIYKYNKSCSYMREKL